MLETFKTRLKAKYPKANLSQKRIDAFADRLHKKFPELTEESDHDEKIDDYYPEEDIMLIAKQDDTIRTLKAKPKDTPETTPKETTTTTTQTETPESESAILLRELRELKGDIQTLKSEKLQTSITQKIQANEKLKEIPAKYYAKRKLPEKEEDIDAFVDEVANDYQEFEQELANKGLSTTVKPVITTDSKGKEKVSPDMQRYLADKKLVDTKN